LCIKMGFARKFGSMARLEVPLPYGGTEAFALRFLARY